MESEKKVKTTPINILVIEDDLNTQLLWEFALNAVHPLVNIMTASNTDDAADLLELALNNDFYYDVVICDMQISMNREGTDIWKKYARASECSVIFTGGTEDEFQKKIEDTFLPVFAPDTIGVHGMTAIAREILEGLSFTRPQKACV